MKTLCRELLDDELAMLLENPHSPQIAELTAHLSTCEACTAEVDAYRLLRLEVAETGEHPAASTLLSYADGSTEIQAAQRTEIQAHLSACPSCRTELNLLQAGPSIHTPPVTGTWTRVRTTLFHPAFIAVAAVLVVVPVVMRNLPGEVPTAIDNTVSRSDQEKLQSLGYGGEAPTGTGILKGLRSPGSLGDSASSGGKRSESFRDNSAPPTNAPSNSPVAKESLAKAKQESAKPQAGFAEERAMHSEPARRAASPTAEREKGRGLDAKALSASKSDDRNEQDLLSQRPETTIAFVAGGTATLDTGAALNGIRIRVPAAQGQVRVEVSERGAIALGQERILSDEGPAQSANGETAQEFIFMVPADWLKTGSYLVRVTPVSLTGDKKPEDSASTFTIVVKE